jgi:hypothetical protein
LEQKMSFLNKVPFFEDAEEEEGKTVFIRTVERVTEAIAGDLIKWWKRVRGMVDGNEFITVSGGDQHKASGELSTILGGWSAITDLYGQVAHASGTFSKIGQAQHGILIARHETTNNNPQNLKLDGYDDRLILKDDSAWAFHILVAGLRVTVGQAGAAWTIEGMIRKGQTPASTTLIGSTVTQIAYEAGLTWAAPYVSPDTVAGALSITCQGAAGDHVRWVAVVDYVDLGSFVYV